MRFSVSAKAMAAAAIGAALLASAGGASAATFLLNDTGAGKTDVLNTTGELTGGDSAVTAGLATLTKKKVVVVGTPAAFTDTALFVIKPNELLTSYSISNQPTSKIGAITGGTAEIFKLMGMSLIAQPLSLIHIDTSTGAPFADYSDSFNLGPGSYELVVKSAGQDFLIGQGAAKYSVALQGTAVPEPATWAVMLAGFGAVGASMRNARRKQALVAA